MLRDINSPIKTVQFADEEDAPKPQLTEIESDDSYGKFEITGLERGWGTTLGNGLRRVLLGSLPGTAIIAARITGSVHEYGSVPHMREGIGEFLINARGIRIRSVSDTSQRVLTLLAEGEGEVVAGDIMSHAQYEIVNPEHHLATLDSQDAKLEVRFEVDQGEGYKAFDQEQSPAVGRLPVDAIFTPVLKANYKVEAMSGRMSGRESLVIEVWTDRTVSPAQALRMAAEAFKSQLEIVSESPDDQEELPFNLPSEVSSTQIETISDEDLGRRTKNALTGHGIHSIGDLSVYEPEELKKNVRNFGTKSFNELQTYMVRIGAWTDPDLGHENDL